MGKVEQLIIFASKDSDEVSSTKRLYSAIGYKTPNEVDYQAINNLDSKGVKLLPPVS